MVVLLALVIGGSAQAATVSSVERVLREAMTPGPTGEERAIDSGAAIRTYIAKGFVSKAPDQRADYVDYRRVRKPASLFGHKLVVLEEEYLTTYIGCCVNPGLGIVVEKKGSLTALTRFVDNNRCAVGDSTEASYSLQLAGVKPKSGATYVSISCRERELIQ
jgi:hypothetical protein